MDHVRPFALMFVLGLLLLGLVVASGLAQAPEPDVPLYAQEGTTSGADSQPQASGDAALQAEPNAELSEAQRASSAPLGADGSETAPAARSTEVEPLPQSIDAPAAITDFRIAGTALKPRGNDVDYIPTAGGGCFYASAGNSFRVFNTGVYLPQGSTILAMRMYYDDTSSSNSRAWFTVYDLYGELVEEWSVDSLGNTGNGFNDTDMISHTIDYLSYSYVINWRPYDLGSDTQLCGFRIFYEPPAAFGAFLPSTWRNFDSP